MTVKPPIELDRRKRLRVRIMFATGKTALLIPLGFLVGYLIFGLWVYR